MRILSQSASVFGTVSTVPFAVVTVRTASKMWSAYGSIMSRISSLTDTTGLRSPQSRPAGIGAEIGAALDAGGCAGFDGDEHVDVRTPRKQSAAQAITRSHAR